MEMAAVVCSLKYNNFTIESTFAVFEPFNAVRVFNFAKQRKQKMVGITA